MTVLRRRADGSQGGERGSEQKKYRHAPSIPPSPGREM
jgi:hypothetical protein